MEVTLFIGRKLIVHTCGEGRELPGDVLLKKEGKKFH